MIQTVENAIVDRLKANISDLKIEGFPEKPSEYRLMHSKGAILVHYQGSKYSSLKSTDPVVQERTLTFGITVVVRRLRKQSGAYAYIEAVRQALTGYKIPGCTKMYPTSEEFISEHGGIWQYGLSFSMRTLAVEVGEDEQLPSLTNVTVDSGEYGTTEVTK